MDHQSLTWNTWNKLDSLKRLRWDLVSVYFEKTKQNQKKKTNIKQHLVSQCVPVPCMAKQMAAIHAVLAKHDSPAWRDSPGQASPRAVTSHRAEQISQLSRFGSLDKTSGESFQYRNPHFKTDDTPISTYSTFFKVSVSQEYSKNEPLTPLHWFPSVMEWQLWYCRYPIDPNDDSWPVARGVHRWSCPWICPAPWPAAAPGAQVSPTTRATRPPDSTRTTEVSSFCSRFWRLKWRLTSYGSSSHKTWSWRRPSWKDAKPQGELDTSVSVQSNLQTDLNTCLFFVQWFLHSSLISLYFTGCACTLHSAPANSHTGNALHVSSFSPCCTSIFRVKFASALLTTRMASKALALCWERSTNGTSSDRSLSSQSNLSVPGGRGSTSNVWCVSRSATGPSAILAPRAISCKHSPPSKL